MATTEGRAGDPFHARTLSFLSRKPLTAVRAARIIALVTVSITVVSGVLIHFLDRANFPSIGGGMWWAVQTVTTVGSGTRCRRARVAGWLPCWSWSWGSAF